MHTVLLVSHSLLAISLVTLVLIQRGKGADIGASFGAGASQTVFGSQGAGSFLTRVTAVIAALFFATSLTLAYFSNQGTEQGSVTDALGVSVPSVVTDKPELSLESDAPVGGDVPSLSGDK